RSERNLIRVIVKLNITADLAVPTLVELLIDEQSLVEKRRRSSGRPNHFTGACEWTIRCDHCDVRSRQNVLGRAQFETRDVSIVSFERMCVSFVEAVEANVVVEEEARIVGENVL